MDMYYGSVFIAYPKYAPLLKKQVFDVLGFLMIFNLLTILSPSAKENISAHTQMPSQNGCTSPRVNKTLLKPMQYFTCLFSLLFFPPCARHRISNHSNPSPFDHHRSFGAPTEPKWDTCEWHFGEVVGCSHDGKPCWASQWNLLVIVLNILGDFGTSPPNLTAAATAKPHGSGNAISALGYTDSCQQPKSHVPNAHKHTRRKTVAWKGTLRNSCSPSTRNRTSLTVHDS